MSRVAHRILIVSPAGPLLEQWRVGLAERFGLRMERIDRELLEAVRKANELGANPFDSIPLGLVSLDFLKQESVLTQLERTSYDSQALGQPGAGGRRLVPTHRHHRLVRATIVSAIPVPWCSTHTLPRPTFWQPPAFGTFAVTLGHKGRILRHCHREAGQPEGLERDLRPTVD
jgi:hypothetical protein